MIYNFLCASGLNKGMRFILGFCFITSLSAQILSTATLSGKYFVRHIEFTTGGTNNITDARSIIGTITFDGAGHYSLNGQQTVLTNPAVSYSVSGTYNVNAAGIVTLTNPQNSAISINARYGVEAVLGSSTEVSANTFDLFVAIPAPTVSQNNASAGAGWSATDFELTAASAAQVRTSMLSMALDGAGNIGILTLEGHAVNFNGGMSISQAVVGGTYSVSSDGSGTIAFPVPLGVTGANAMLSPAPRTLYISKSGNVILAGTPGAHDLFVAIRNASGTITLTSGQRFWNAGIRLDASGSSDSYTGSSTVIAADSAFISSRRLHETGAASFNETAASLFTLATDGTGSLGPGEGGDRTGLLKHD